MTTRSFALSTLAIIGLSLTTGCGEPLVGTWDMVSLNDGDELSTFPQTEQGQGYTVEVTGEMVIGDDLKGSLNIHGKIVAEGAEETISELSQAITGTKTGKGAYTLELVANEEAGLDANTMTCALDESLVCTDKDDVVITLTERQE